jgi:hypothetical protein
MNPQKILVYTIVLIFTFQNLQGQKSLSKENLDLISSELCLTGELFTPDFIVDGITYYNSEWLPGDIYLSNGEVVRNKLIKYNGMLDELFWQEPKSKNVIKLDKEAIVRFHFQNFNGDPAVYFKKIKIRRNNISDSSEVYGQVMYEGNLSLYILHTYKTAGTELIRQNGNLFEKTNYVEEPEYIFRLTSNKTFIVKNLYRKNFYAFAPDKKDQIKKFFIERRKSKFKNNSELIGLTQFLSSIVDD